MRAILFALLITASSVGQAADVLIDRIPQSATPEVVMAVVTQALVTRGWKVEEVATTSISATITREAQRVIVGRIRIAIEGSTLVYTGKSTYRTEGTTRGMRVYDRPLSNLWVNNLRRDIGLTLATMPDHQP